MQFNLDDACKKNRVICHPNDYNRFVESGVVEMLTKGGVEVIPTELAEEGKQIATGELATAIFEKWRIEK